MTKLHIPELKDAIALLPSAGKLQLSQNSLLYLNIDDAFIHQLFPLLNNQHIKKPDYFCTHGVGAHISVIYPEESKKFNREYLNQKFYFSFCDLVIAEIHLKKYYVLLVESPELITVRKNHGLPDKLNFKNYEIGFHITIGVGNAI